MKKMRALSLMLSMCMIAMLFTSCQWFGGSSSDDAPAVSVVNPDNHTGFDEGFTEETVVDESSAIKAVESVASDLGLTDPQEELQVSDVTEIAGATYYRMQQYYQDIPVYGKTVVISTDEDGNVTALTANSVEIPDDTVVTPSVTVKQVNKSVATYCEEFLGAQDASAFDVGTLDDSALTLYQHGDEIRLAYVLSVGFYEILVDAVDAEVLAAFQVIVEDSMAVCYNGDGSLSFDGYYDSTAQEYIVYNEARGITVYNYNGENSKSVTYIGREVTGTDNYFGNTQAEAAAGHDEAVTYIVNLSAIYDYFASTFSDIPYEEFIAGYNDGYDNGENAVGGRMHGKGYISMGSVTGVEALDTMAHEYTHIVTGRRVNWVSIAAWSAQEDQPGAINEAYSDIFGELIEAKMENKEPDWVHGDRVIYDPMSNEYPAKIGDKTYELFRTDKWGMDVGGGYYTDYSHGFSTIISHAAYLMWNGIDGTQEQKIDADRLAQLWYRAMMFLHADATFTQCAAAVTMAAEQMYKDPAVGFTADQLACVQAAFDKVGITEDAAYTLVANGSTVYAMDDTHTQYHDDYHLLIQSVDSASNTLQTVLETDITDENGYTFDLSDGVYRFTVSDNAENGSDYTYTKTVKVASSKLPQPAVRNIYIYTDFKKAIAVTDFTLPDELVVTLGELTVIEPEITPADATGFSVKWTSSDESIATVSPTGEAGIITTLTKGTVTITAELTSKGRTITKSTQLRVASKARDTVLVLDVSGSMYGEPLEEMKESAIQFCNDLLSDEYNNRVGLVFYDDSVNTVNLTNDLDSLIAYIEAVDGGGTTNMEAGLSAADAMLQSQGAANSIKNVVIMADGLPNNGKMSSSGSMPDGSYSSYSSSMMYANAVIDTAKDMMTRYNMYSLGFFHSLYGVSKEFAVALMPELTNQSDGYYQVDQAEDLQFAFGDISEEINVGSKIVINIACPVDVTVSYNGEILSSAADHFSDVTSFGTLHLLGKNQDIKVLSLDSEHHYEVEIHGTGTGKMDYSINYFDGEEKLYDYRCFEAVPILPTTVIKTDTDNTQKDIALNVDNDGDGEIDIVWTAQEKGSGIVTYEREPAEPEESQETTATTTVATPTETQATIVQEEQTQDGTPLWAIALIGIVIVMLIGGVAIVVATTGRSGRSTQDEDVHIPVRQAVAPPAPVMEETAVLKRHDTMVRCAQCGRMHVATQTCECFAKAVYAPPTKKDTSGVGIIKVTNGALLGFSVPIKDGETLCLGKDPRIAHLVFPAEYHSVSRVHCTVTYDAKSNRYYVVDSSTNGTYFKNKQRLEKNKRTLVNANTELILANAQCTVWLG